jgi:RHS repeat-associated protein
VKDEASGEFYVPSFDGNRNVTRLIKYSDRTVSAEYEYAPFGTLLRATGPMAGANPFRFSSEYHDDGTGLVYYGYRYYSPETHRWLSKDPIGYTGGLNLYGFVGNDPVNGRDLLGLHEDNNRPPEKASANCPGKYGPPAIEPNIDREEPSLEEYAMIGATAIPGVGEAMDVDTLLSDDTSWLEKTLSAGSLGINVITGGVLPNYGGFTKALKARRAAKALKMTPSTPHVPPHIDPPTPPTKPPKNTPPPSKPSGKKPKKPCPNDTLNGGDKIDPSKLAQKPSERGNAPIGEDGHPVELHHRNQAEGNDSPLDEMTRTDHRGPGNYKENHPNTGQSPTTVDRNEFDNIRNKHWNQEWDSGRFDELPDM